MLIILKNVVIKMETGAEELSKLIEDEFGLFNGKINKTRALCSYYAEPGSILIGFEA